MNLNPERQHESDKTHYADPDTLATLAKLGRENADLRADRDRAFKIGYEITDDCQTVEEMTSALVACIQRVRMNKDKELADLRAKLEEARKDAERYRWLRDNIGYTFDETTATAFLLMPRKQELTAYIDAAIAQGKGEK